MASLSPIISGSLHLETLHSNYLHDYPAAGRIPLCPPILTLYSLVGTQNAAEARVAPTMRD